MLVGTVEIYDLSEVRATISREQPRKGNTHHIGRDIPDHDVPIAMDCRFLLVAG